MDPYLLSIIEAAEAGAPTPAVHVVTSGGDWIQGQPCPSSEFRNITWPHFVQEVRQHLRRRPRQERKDNPLEADAVAVEPFAAVTPVRGGDANSALTLSQATLSFGGRGDGMNLPVLRIPTHTVSSWWVCGGSYIKPKSSGGGVVGGVIFPIGN
jgi:hypothetical protein